MNENNYRAIFFDLDGTLLPLDMDRFMGGYFLSLESFIEEHGHDVKKFTQALRKGMESMARSDGFRTNADVFWDTFYLEIDEQGSAKTDWESLLDEFYLKDFGQIGAGMPLNPLSAEVIDVLKKKGYPLALTTMPMFPPIAVNWRLSWGDLSAEAFDRITTFDNSTAIKPNLSYYEENLAAFGCRPEEVLMVGNNTREDLACLELGMPAYLITDCLLNSNDFDVETVPHGSMEDFLTFANSLPRCANPAVCTAPAVGMVSA